MSGDMVGLHSWITQPDGAVVGGYLASGDGTNLYMIRSQVAMDDQFGYWNPNTNLGYVEASSAAQTYTRIDLMALA